ncbi:hypothetical protein FZC66_00570 [Priestia megaterium]|nr:hypothetical protein FZC66_00570 [Priestia megaterium]
MAETLEELRYENQLLRLQLQEKDQRIKELEVSEKELNDFKHKQAHDRWVSGGRKGNRGVRK